MATVNEIRADRAFEIVEDAAELFILQMESDLIEEHTKYSPRDTGWLRANFFPGLGAPYRADAERPDNPDVATSKARSLEADRASAENQIRRSFKLGTPVYISNNVPYLEDVNETGSRKDALEAGEFYAPPGFLEYNTRNAIDRTIHKFGQYAREIGGMTVEFPVANLKNRAF